MWCPSVATGALLILASLVSCHIGDQKPPSRSEYLSVRISNLLEDAMSHRKYEYKIHYLALETGKSNEEQLIVALNEFGKDGWRLNRLYGEVSLRSITSWKGGLNLLLERETDV